MQLSCPTCHAAFPIEAALQHEAGREVMATLAGMAPELALPLVHYIGYFRPAKQQLGWGRALRLMREVLALQAMPADVLALGLAEAARTLDDKRAAPGWKPLGNHNYLLRCLESAQARSSATGVVLAAAGGQAKAGPAPGRALAGFKTLQGMRK